MRNRVLIRAALAIVAIALAQLTVAPTARAATPAVAAAQGNYLFHHEVSGLCLDGSASQGARLNTCSSRSRYQQWSYWSDGTFQNDFGLCLDGSVSQGVRVTECTEDNPYQLWLLTVEPNGNYSLANLAYDGRQSVDASASQGVRMKDTNHGVYQQWWITAV